MVLCWMLLYFKSAEYWHRHLVQMSKMFKLTDPKLPKILKLLTVGKWNFRKCLKLLYFLNFYSLIMSNFSIFGNFGSVNLNILDIWMRRRYQSSADLECNGTQYNAIQQENYRNIQQNTIVTKLCNYIKCRLEWIDTNCIVLHGINVELHYIVTIVLVMFIKALYLIIL